MQKRSPTPGAAAEDDEASTTSTEGPLELRCWSSCTNYLQVDRHWKRRRLLEGRRQHCTRGGIPFVGHPKHAKISIGNCSSLYQPSRWSWMMGSSGHDDFVEAHLARTSLAHANLLDRIPSIADVQSAWALLLRCANARATYLFGSSG